MSRFIITKNVNQMDGLCVIEPILDKYPYGTFLEVYNEQEFANYGLDMKFVQDNEVYSIFGVLRGLHVNFNHPQGKLIRVLHGSIFDVVVDLRKESKTYKKWYGIELSSENRKQLYIPERFAHGYLVVSKDAAVSFKVTQHFIPGDEIGIAWNSPELDIKWPQINAAQYILNKSDLNNKNFSELII